MRVGEIRCLSETVVVETNDTPAARWSLHTRDLLSVSLRHHYYEIGRLDELSGNRHGFAAHHIAMFGRYAAHHRLTVETIGDFRATRSDVYSPDTVVGQHLSEHHLRKGRARGIAGADKKYLHAC